MIQNIAKLLSAVIAVCLLLSACTFNDATNIENTENTLDTTAFAESVSIDTSDEFDFDAIPKFDDEPYVIINDNVPDFDKSDYTTQSYETYGELDELGRCTSCISCIGTDLMPTEKRESIGSIKPTGWHSDKYANIDSHYLYNRCHLIGYQLTAENANERNLITGTRYLNVSGMLPFEDEIAEYVKATGNHVLYRVTPLFKGNELVARGVHMEGSSVEDNGKSISFNIYCYNNQPGIKIDYKTGESSAVEEKDNFDDESDKDTFIVNLKTKKFHKTDCPSVNKINSENRKKYTGSRSNLTKNGYEPCNNCKP